LTYNISFGRVPDTARLFSNSENQMIDYGTIYARGAPCPRPGRGLSAFV